MRSMHRCIDDDDGHASHVDDDSVARGDDETLDRARVPPSPIDTNDDDDDRETDDDDGLQR